MVTLPSPARLKAWVGKKVGKATPRSPQPPATPLLSQAALLAFTGNRLLSWHQVLLWVCVTGSPPPDGCRCLGRLLLLPCSGREGARGGASACLRGWPAGTLVPAAAPASSLEIPGTNSGAERTDHERRLRGQTDPGSCPGQVPKEPLMAGIFPSPLQDVPPPPALWQGMGWDVQCKTPK